MKSSTPKAEPSLSCQIRKVVSGNWSTWRLTLLTLVAITALAGAQPTVAVPANFAGMSFLSGEVPNNFVGTVGTLGKEPATSWPYIESTSSTPNWAPLDKVVQDMRTLGLTHFIYFVGATPGWAVANHSSEGETNQYTKQWISWLPPDNMTNYTNFIQALLTRYPQIELVYNYCEPQDEPIPYAGAVAMDTELISYVHANFPGVLVGSPTIQPRDTDAQNLAAGYWYYDYWNGTATSSPGPKNFDVILWHGYPGFEVVTPSANTPERVASRRGHMNALLSHFSLTQPVWDEESSWGGDSVATNNSTDTVAFASQDLLLHWNSGDSRFVWYGGEGFGYGTLASAPSGTLNAAGVGWNYAQSWMLGSTLTSPGITLTGATYNSDGSDQAVTGIRSGVWTRPGGYRAISAWTVDGSTPVFTVPANTPPYVQYRDTSGNVTPIIGGQVMLSGRPIWIETGNSPLIFEDDLSGIWGATRTLPSSDYSSIQTATAFTLSSGAYLNSTIPVSTPPAGEDSIVTYTPSSAANSWAQFASSVTVGGVVYETLNGAFDLFVGPNTTEAGSNWFHPVDVDGRSGSTGMRLIFSGATNSGPLELEIETGSSAGLGTSPGVFTANNTFSLSGAIDNIPNPFAAGALVHLGITFNTNPATGQVTMKVFGVRGVGPIDTTSTTDLLKSQSFYISGTAVGAHPLPTGAWTMWARPYTSAGAFTVITNVDYDSVRLYQADPGVFTAIP